jgi:hypothetical protein
MELTADSVEYGQVGVGTGDGSRPPGGRGGR